MGCNNRMQITMEAMKLFMQSLPSNCQFGIISFGSNADWMSNKQLEDYNNQSRDTSLSQITNFSSNYGGTDILTPLRMAFTLPQKANTKKRIFLLTDGTVSNGNEIKNYVNMECSKNDNVKLFSFGIGSGCDENLVRNSAIAGKGECSIIGDNDPVLLKEKVVNSLKKASEPSL